MQKHEIARRGGTKDQKNYRLNRRHRHNESNALSYKKIHNWLLQMNGILPLWYVLYNTQYYKLLLRCVYLV